MTQLDQSKEHCNVTWFPHVFRGRKYIIWVFLIKSYMSVGRKRQIENKMYPVLQPR